ncbi:hypothetical protein BDZ89DRAFT_986811 [Hymenopellis radicata]|nr:hypothetical protein BDZ89DRAFT_986811 [Hymenopellis radicata]
MSRPGFRQHRLPPLRTLDYTLIPAPLDFSSLPTLTEKSPLPAIVVTPSSPRSPTDYSIAFLAPEPKPTLLKRMRAYTPSLRARTAIILFLILFILMCHVVTHRLAARRPFLEFGVQPGEPVVQSWFSLQALWGGDDLTEDKRDFVISEVVGAAT